MRPSRLYVDQPLRPGSEVMLPPGPAGHAVRVLRLRPGGTVIAFNGDGCEYPARLVAAHPREVRLQVTGVASPDRESPLRLTLIQALARGEKMDWIVRKATELGVARIVPVATERSELRLDAGRAERRLAHWRAVAVAACEQCGRNVVPAVDAPAALAAWLAAEQAGLPATRLVLCPGQGVRPRDAAPGNAAVLAVGPEGGFGDADLTGLHSAGFTGLLLGPRVLRTETAGVAAIAALQARFGDL